MNRSLLGLFAVLALCFVPSPARAQDSSADPTMAAYYAQQTAGSAQAATLAQQQAVAQSLGQTQAADPTVAGMPYGTATDTITSTLQNALPGIIGAAAGGLLGFRLGGAIGGVVGALGGFVAGQFIASAMGIGQDQNADPAASSTLIPPLSTDPSQYTSTYPSADLSLTYASGLTTAPATVSDPTLMAVQTQFQPAAPAAPAATTATDLQSAQDAMKAAFTAYQNALAAGGTADAERQAYLNAEANFNTLVANFSNH